MDYTYDQKVVDRAKNAQYYRGLVFLIISILPFYVFILVIVSAFSAPLSRTLFGIGLFAGWCLMFFLFGYVIRRIERFTVQHRNDTIRIINKTIYWCNQVDGYVVSVAISEATIDYCYYAAGSTIFKITDKNTGNIIYFSTHLSRFEEILKIIDPDFDWSPALFD